jgi:hypothetical protein
MNSGDERQQTTVNGTSDERGALEKEASSSKEEGRRLCCLFIERGRGEERSLVVFNGHRCVSFFSASMV